MNRPTEPAAISLDVWYTLLYQTAGARRAYEQARARSWRAALAGAGLAGPAVEARLHALAREAGRRESLGRAFPLSEQAEFVAPGRVDVGRLARSLARALANARVDVTPGAKGALETLRARGLALGLVSNVVHEPPEAIRALLRRTGLDRRVDAIVLSTEVGAAKPSGRPLTLLLHRVGARPSATLHVGDSDVDLIAAWRAGASAVRYVGVRRHWPAADGRRREPPGPSVPEVARWGELTAHLPALWRAARRASPGSVRRARSGRAPRGP